VTRVAAGRDGLGLGVEEVLVRAQLEKEVEDVE
jgi:hypothetical protein